MIQFNIYQSQINLVSIGNENPKKFTFYVGQIRHKIKSILILKKMLAFV